MSWIELRECGIKTFSIWTPRNRRSATRLAKYELRVNRYRQPALQSGLAGAPAVQFSPKSDKFHADFGFNAAGRCAPPRHRTRKKQFQTDRVRCFDFWRLEDQAPYRKANHEKIERRAAEAAKSGIKLVLENEMTCNTAPQPEAAQVLAAIPDPNTAQLDPGNAAALEKLRFRRLSPVPKGRHRPLPLQGCARKPDGSTNGQPWQRHHRLGDNSARCAEDGYRLAASLETHWHGAGTPEESSRQKLGWNAKGICARRRFVNARLANLNQAVPG